MPRVSIVLPTYNRLQYLRAAVDSIFDQTFSDWELIIADDGSDEDTRAYLESLIDRAQVLLLTLPHTGNPGTVRNVACRIARGEYIAFQDSDDVWLPQKLAIQVAALDAQPDCAWSNTGFALIGTSGELLTGTRARAWPCAQGRILHGLIEMTTVLAMPTVLVRRSLLEQVGGFDTKLRMCEDYDLYLRLAAASEICGVPTPLVHVRSHHQHYHEDCQVFDDRRRALEKLLAAPTDRGLHAILRKERARAAADLARSQVLSGRRWAALRTLIGSSKYSWTSPRWWRGGIHTAARVVAPAGLFRLTEAATRGSE